jgi:two-component system sensor histidine kinase KdpD
LLAAGINVLSTLNIQHLESLNDVIEEITGVTQRETIPDHVVRRADQVELVDMTPEALRRRMAHGNIYTPDKVDAALGHYFRHGNLAALRELALLWVADRVDDELAAYRKRHGITDPWETKERVVVAITGAPGGDDVIRRASRMAVRSHAELIGVHVRPADGVSRPSGDGLDMQRALLNDLKGRYGEVTGLNVAAALVSFAKAENATQLVVGASRRSRWSELTRGSVVNEVVRLAGPLDVHVISPELSDSATLPSSPARGRLMTYPRRRRNLAWLLGTVGMAALGAALSPLRATLELPGALLCLLLGVVGVALIGGAAPAMAAAVVASLAGDFFFTLPYHSFRMVQATQILDLIVFFAVAIITVLLVERLARRSVQVTRAQAEAEALARLAGGSVLSSAGALPTLVAELRRTFDVDGVAVLAPSDAGWRVVAGAGEPITSPQHAPFQAELDDGAVLVLAGRSLDSEDTRLLSAFIAQLRQAQEHIRLEAEASTAVELAEANRLRSALLAAVSHDLRTPLAGIKAAATSLLSSDVEWEPDQARAFAKTIDDETDRLTRLVTNLLDMSRLQAHALPVTIRPIAVEDIVYAAVASLGSASAAVAIDIAEELPPTATDAGLLERALGNVIDNALAWSPAGTAVRIEASAVADRLHLRVIDQGPGISPEDRDRVFQPFQRLGDGTGGRPNGVGLGLAVARGFVEALDGELRLEDTPSGGTTAIFDLPRVSS